MSYDIHMVRTGSSEPRPTRVLDEGVHGSARILGPTSAVYTPVDPADLCADLECAGYEASWRPAMDRRHRVRPGVATVTVCSHFGGRLDDGAYNYGASIFLSHRGDAAIRLVPRIVRVACANQFHFAPVAIPHCSVRARQFVDDPTVEVRKIIEFGSVGLARLESLRGVGASQTPTDGLANDLLAALRHRRPRLAAAVWRVLPEYLDLDGPSAWAFVQACAVPGGRAGLRTLVTDLLTDGYEDLVAGRVPACLN